MADDSRIIAKREAFKRLQSSPDFHLLVHEMNAIAKRALRAQLDTNPLKEPEKAMEYKLLRTVLTQTIPERMAAIINYEPTAPDKQVAPQHRWSFTEFFKRVVRR